MNQRSALADLIAHTRSAPPFTGRILVLDPGETTGWAVFDRQALVEAGDFRVTSPLLFDHLITHKLPGTGPNRIMVMENYRVYAHKLQRHSGSEVPTIQYVGTLKYLAAAYNLPLVLQMAHQAKAFVKDERLVKLGLWHGSKHARDAIRHGVYFLMFGTNP